MNKCKLELSELDVQQIFIALHRMYLNYNEEYTDEEVYRYNTVIDDLITRIKNQLKEGNK